MNRPLFRATMPLVLASASPRRKHFLRELGLAFRIHPAAVDETPLAGEGPDAFAGRMAETKADVVAERFPDSLVIAADTVVCVDGDILGKPADPAEALVMLGRLVNRSHRVITGLAIHCRKKQIRRSATESTTVVFADWPEPILAAYVRSGEPLDKAGAYGIQGKGGFLVREISGSCSNVVGLPIHLLVRWLLEHQAIGCTPGS